MCKDDPLHTFPCPFCGGPGDLAKWSRDGYELWSVECTEETCIIGLIDECRKYPWPEEAVEEWNTRTSPPPAIPEGWKAALIALHAETQARFDALGNTTPHAHGRQMLQMRLNAINECIGAILNLAAAPKVPQ